MGSLLQDVRYAVRRLGIGPGFTLAVVLTLAVGIGGATATFSVVDAAVLRPLPFPDAERLVRLREVTPQGEGFPISEPDYLDYARRLRTLGAIAAMKPLELTITGAGDAARIDGAAVTSTLFPLLGIRPEQGRLLTADDDRDDQPSPVVVISHAMWRQRFGGDPAAVGRVVTLDGRSVTIVGVLPATAVFPPADAWVPLGASARSDRTDKWLDVIGRMAPGVGARAVRDEAVAVTAGLAQAHPELAGWSASVESLDDWLVGPGLRRMVWVLMGAVAVLLALACANVAGLLMVRAASRGTEIGVRAALGAGRGRLVRQLATEHLLLGLIGGALGLLAASWMVAALSALLTDVLPLGREARIDLRAVSATVGIMLAATVGFGLLPAVHTARTDLQGALRSARRTTPASRRWSGALVGVQVALAMVLLAGAFLLMGSFARLSRVDAGFDASNILTVPVSLPAQRYPEAARPAFFDRAIAKLTAVPGVESVAATATNPFRQWGYANDVTPEDRVAEAPASGLFQAGWRSVTPGFFGTLGVPLLDGRAFTAGDRPDGPGVVIASRSLADRLWPGARAVGRRLYWGGLGGRPKTVIGVVGDVRDVRLDAPATPMLYLPYGQVPLEGMTLLVRTRKGVTGVPDAVRRQMRALDPALPISEIRPLQANRAAAISAPRFRTVMLAVFGFAALLLAAVGLYGVVAFTVAERTREIAIRVALGARPSQVTRLFFRRGLVLAVGGGLAGLAVALMAAGVLRALLFDTSPRDPGMFALAAGLLASVTLLASYLPARRAAALDPLVALTRE